MSYLFDRLKEGSTWRGIMALLIACGVKVRPDLQDAVISSGMAVIGLMNVLRKEK